MGGDNGAVPRTRLQYAIANIGMFNAVDRLQVILGRLGADGWELTAVYDKSSNWLQGLEKGFILLKRPVFDDDEPDGGWAVQVDKNGNVVPPAFDTEIVW